MTKPSKQKTDHEIVDLEEALLHSIEQAKQGEFAAVHGLEKIKAVHPIGKVDSAPEVQLPTKSKKT